MELLRTSPAITRAVARFTLAAALCAFAAGLGCVTSHTTTPYRVDVMGGVGRAAVVTPQPPPPPPPEVTPVPGKGFSTYDVVKLYRPEPCGGEGTAALGAIAYLNRTPGPKHWVVVLPIWGSSTYPPWKLVSWFTHGEHRASTNVLWVQNPGKPRLMDYPAMEAATTVPQFMTALERSAACIQAASDDIRTWVSWIQEQPDTDTRRIGIAGCSIGAIVASLTMGRDPRLSAGAFAMGGGRLDEILASCYGEEAKVREVARERFGWDDAAFLNAVREPLAPVDPVKFAGNIDPAAVLFIDAGHDTCIPKSARDDLWEAMGRPERITLGYSHRNSFLTMTFLGFDRTTERIVSFLDARLHGPMDLTAGHSQSKAESAQPQ